MDYNNTSAFVAKDNDFGYKAPEGFNSTGIKILDAIKQKKEQSNIDKKSIGDALKNYKGRFFKASEEGAVELRDWYAGQINNRVNPNNQKFREEFRDKFWKYERQIQRLENLDKRVAELIAVADGDPYMRADELKKWVMGELGKKSLNEIDIDAINEAILNPRFNNIEGKIGAFVETLDSDLEIKSKDAGKGFKSFQAITKRPDILTEGGQDQLIDSILNSEEEFFTKKDLQIINRIAQGITETKLEAGDDTSVRIEARNLIRDVFEKKAIEEYGKPSIRQEYRPRADTSNVLKQKNLQKAREDLTIAFKQAKTFNIPNTSGKVDKSILSRWMYRGGIKDIKFTADMVNVTVEKEVVDPLYGKVMEEKHFVFDNRKAGDFERLLDFLESRRNLDVKAGNQTLPDNYTDDPYSWMRDLDN